MNKAKLEQKFEEIYSKRIEPRLFVFEEERQNIKQRLIILSLLAAAASVLCFFFLPINMETASKTSLFIFIFAVVLFVIYAITAGPFEEKIKRELLNLVLSVFGPFYMTTEEVIEMSEIKASQFFPGAVSKNDDDNIVGKYKDLDIYICETELTHTEYNGTDKDGHANRRPVTDFKGLLIKVKMKKRFKGVTIVRSEQKGTKIGKLQRVNLEDPEFEKIFNVFSDDQIESRYILTTAFMGRIKALRESFSKQNQVGFAQRLPQINCMFKDGFILMSLTTYENFFEVGNLWSSMLDKGIYEKVFYQMAAVLDLVSSLKLEQNTGL